MRNAEALIMLVLLLPMRVQSANNMFTPGRIWNDDRGKPIHAHLGGVLFDKDVYYWYGLNWDTDTIPPNTLPKQSYAWYRNMGINIYSSRDLYNWKYESTVLSETSDNREALLQPFNALVRPKMIKNDASGKYVMMAALTSPDFDTFNDVVVAVSDNPVGPFQLLGKLGWRTAPNRTGIWAGVWKGAESDPPERIRGFDMGLFKDDDGKAYLMVGHYDVWLYELSEDYLSAVKVERMEGAEGESPALFKAAGVYCLLTSRLTGWAPNQNTYFTASSIWGPWQAMGAFARGPKAQTTFDSQTAFVLPVPEQLNAFIFIADRFHATSSTSIPDIRKAVYIWLPIQFNNVSQTMQVPWLDEWDLSAFDDMRAGVE